MTFVHSFLLDLPDEGPVITGGYPRYHIGDKVRVNCTSRRSKPAAKLKWYINGEQADHYHTKHFEVLRKFSWLILANSKKGHP